MGHDRENTKDLKSSSDPQLSKETKASVEWNTDMRQKQRKNLLFVVGGGIIVAIAVILFHTSSQSTPHKNSTPNMVGIINADFTQSNTNSALKTEQADMDQVKRQVSDLKTQLEQKKLEETTSIQAQQEQARQITELKQQLNEVVLSATLRHSKESSHANRSAREFSSSSSNSLDEALEAGQTAQKDQIDSLSSGMTSMRFSYDKSQLLTTKDGTSMIPAKTPTDYVPAGTFARAVMLSGADANASVNGKSDSTPIALRILDSGTLPNGEHSHLTDCFVVASVYGDISSERGEVRLQNLSCVRPDKTILDIPIEGTIYDQGGKEGERGHPVMRNGPILWYAGLSGFFAGLGSAAQQSLTNQSTSSLGTVTTVPSNKVWQSGAFGGANTALNKLADYYIKRADQYHPIIQIGAGNIVDVLFLKGFYLDDDASKSSKNSASSAALSSTSSINHSANLTALPAHLIEMNNRNHPENETSLNSSDEAAFSPNLSSKEE